MIPRGDPGLLDAAAARPQTSLFGDDAYPTPELMAAAQPHSICRYRALVDGNKRLALLATVTFLRANGRRARWTQDEACDPVMAVAEGSLDVADIAARLEE